MITVHLPEGFSFEIEGKLKPCPYCGNENVELKMCGAGYYVECDIYACNRLSYAIFPRAIEAVEAWNNEMQI